MVDSIGFESNFSIASNATNVKPEEIYLGFGKLLVEKAVSQQTALHGFVGDGQDLCPGLNEMTIDGIKALMSLSDGSKNIWEIVLQLEKRVDIEDLNESMFTDFDNVAGRNSVQALLTQFWKKKELLGEDIPKYKVDNSTCFNQDHIHRKTVSELENLILKNKERKLITAD